SLDGGRARRAIEERHLSEEVARTDTCQHLLHAAGHRLRDHEGARADQEHLVTSVALAQQDLPALERTFAQAVGEDPQLGGFDVTKQAHAPEKSERVGATHCAPLAWPRWPRVG